MFYPPRLNDLLLLQHLRGESSYGVFSTLQTKFLVFDFDFEEDILHCKWYYYKVYYALKDAGIPEENIYTFYSGNKGLHLTIYFDNPIPTKDALLLYYTVLEDADSLHMCKKIEFRPTSKQGVKLPLGFHTKTRNKVCFLENLNLKNKLPDETILQINKLCSSIFDSVINQIKERITYSDVAIEDDTKDILSNNHISSETASTNHLRMDPAYYNDIWQNGLKVVGTRHDMTLMLLLYFKTIQQMDKDEAKDAIFEWLARQDKSKYHSSILEVRKDTEALIDYVYDNDKRLYYREKSVTLSKEEAYHILTARRVDNSSFTLKQKKVLLALYLQSKFFTNEENRIFYMTYKQIGDSIGYKNTKSLSKLFCDFVEAHYLLIHRRDTKQANTYQKLPNLYEVPSLQLKKATIMSNVDSITFNSDLMVSTLTKLTLNQIARYFFDKKQLALVLPRRQVEQLFK
ncbi:TOTE conflict system archaeo-eukaryotic primase domain-containing protein [Lysinibacillus sp. UGB7]|uniref:TOTE conflict system archaeo-eukaryotic primase domain-containing protein n=1 Tax=Lysinibacillus sp. UGB7 TaxID=3411039 RepID=UPI003B7BBC34